MTALAVDAKRELRDWFRKLNPSHYKLEYRDLAKHLHPDHGGTHELFVALNEVYEEARNGQLNLPAIDWAGFPVDFAAACRRVAERDREPCLAEGWGVEPSEGQYGTMVHAKRDCFTLRRTKKPVAWRSLVCSTRNVAESWLCGHCGGYLTAEAGGT